MSNEVKQGDQVQIEYTGRLKDGTVFDSTEERGAFSFTAGSPDVIQGMSSQVIGMEKGQEKSFEIPPEEAYGEYDPSLVVKVERSKIPDEADVGDALSDGSGQGPVWFVREMADDHCVLDANHPLAGETLVFDVKVVEVG